MTQRDDSYSDAQAIAAWGKAFCTSIKAGIGPDERVRIAQERYARGEIDADELERLVGEALR